MKRDIQKSFFDKIDKTSNPNGCWIWKGATNQNGYGFIWHDGKSTMVHRFAWELKFGEIPDGLCACHKCDNPPCVNTDHIFLGTPKQNTQDSVLKGRHRCRNYGFVTHSDVQEIRKNYQGRKGEISVLAVRYKMSYRSMHELLRRNTYKNI